VQFIDARDLAEWTIRLVEQRAFGAFNGVGPATPLPVGDLLPGIRDAIGSSATLVHADAAFLEAQTIQPWSDLPAWVPGSGETAGFSRVSNARAVATGLTFRPLATTARDTLAFWNSLPAARRAQPRAGLSAEREAAALAAWRARPKTGS
jgi:2'-hydroxyisoflavone reductase